MLQEIILQLLLLSCVSLVLLMEIEKLSHIQVIKILIFAIFVTSIFLVDRELSDLICIHCQFKNVLHNQL